MAAPFPETTLATPVPPPLPSLINTRRLRAQRLDTSAPFGDGPEATLFTGSFKTMLPIDKSGFLDAQEVSAAVAWLASDDSKYVTGLAVPVDAGVMVR